MLSDLTIKVFKKKGYCVLQDDSSLLEHKDYDYDKEIHRLIINELKGEKKSIEVGIMSYPDNKTENYPQYTIYYNKDRVDLTIVTNLTEFVSNIINTDSKTSSYIYYRGHSNWEYLFRPSIYRKENVNILRNEDKLFRDIISSKPHFFNDCMTTLDKLVKLQHHGLPTRLMDLTENPFIALFFACNSGKSTQGEVTIFKIPEGRFKYYDSDTVSVLANLAKSPIDFDANKNDYVYDEDESLSLFKTSDEVKEFNKKEEVRKLVHNIREEKSYFLNRVDPKHLKNYSVVVKPKMAIDRIINQSGAFVLFGINAKKDICSELNINEKGYKPKVFIIPSNCKKDILEQLKLFNINDSTVFCDIDSTARFFKDKYK